MRSRRQRQKNKRKHAFLITGQTIDISKKENCQKLHAIKRAKERYNIDLSITSLAELSKQIKDQKSIHVGSTSLNKSIHIIAHNNISYPVSYDKKRKTITTFLPKDWRTEDSSFRNEIEPKIQLFVDNLMSCKDDAKKENLS